MPKISIIIPCYNQAKYIKECLDSVLAQTFKDFEAIVVNDGSTDNSLEIIEEYAKNDLRIKIINQKNSGVVIARNSAIKKALGEFIYPLDGDDKIASNCLELLYKAVIEDKGDVICSDVEFFGEKHGKMYLNKPTKFTMAIGNSVVCSALYKKIDALKYGGYDENMKSGLEDWEFWCNFVYDNKKFYKIKETLFFYRILPNSRNNSINNENELKKYIRQKHSLVIYYAFGNLYNKILKFLYNKKITSKNKQVIEICKIRIYSKKVNIIE